MFAIFSCDNHKEVAALQEETNAIHDSAMADLAGMKRTKRAVRKEIESLDSLALANPYRDSLFAVLSLMEKAENDMNTWMVNYKAPKADTPKDEALLYLTEQRDFMQNNSMEISTANQKGKNILEIVQSNEK